MRSEILLNKLYTNISIQDLSTFLLLVLDIAQGFNLNFSYLAAAATHGLLTCLFHTPVSSYPSLSHVICFLQAEPPGDTLEEQPMHWRHLTAWDSLKANK